MKRVFVKFAQACFRQVLTIGLMVLLGLSGCLFWLQQPSYASAASQPLTPDEKVDRAYELRLGTGIREEEYQNRLQDGEDPTQMHKPYRRVLETNQEAIPKTSQLETAIHKTQNLADQLTGKQ